MTESMKNFCKIEENMKIRLFLLLVWGLCGSALGDGKAIGLQGTGLATTTEGGQKWALVVGINEYSNVPALQYASADAKGLYNALIKAGFPSDNIMLMTDTATGPMYPTRGNLRARINQLATLVEKEDVLLVFFSGHGTEKNGQGYLVPIDGSTTDVSSLVPLSWVKKTLETSGAKHRLLILDACHSGAKAGDAAASPAKAMLSSLSGAAFATLSSCDTDQLSYEDKESGHGVFTSAIIEGLSGAADKQAQGNNDNIVNATELWAYAALKTKQWGIRNGKTQTPVLKGNFKGLIEIARFKSLKELKEQKDKLRKKLEMMEQLNRNSAAEELRKEIAKLETQLNSISGGVEGITGSDEVQLAYTRYKAAKKQVDDLEDLLAEKLKVYQPTSRAIARIKERMKSAKAELEAALDTKYQANAIMYEALQTQIVAKKVQYDELTKELLPTAAQVKKLAVDISEMMDKQQIYIRGYVEVNAKTNSIGMKLIWIPPGEFMMGSSDGESDEKPVHQVSISKGFWMGIYEVTQAQYRSVMGTNPSEYKGDSNPVEMVSWKDATEFCKKLSEKEGRIYTLPTEAQWEYACRAGSTPAFSFGVDSCRDREDYAWYSNNSGRKLHPVGQKRPNNFGLYDMCGNVEEWCRDYYNGGYYTKGIVVDPENTQSTKSGRVLRGGSSWSFSYYCTSYTRTKCYNSRGYSGETGFRVVLKVE